MIISGALFFGLVTYASSIHDLIGYYPHKILIWVSWIFGILGMLDAMQFINLFKFIPNEKLIKDIERRPSKTKQPWE